MTLCTHIHMGRIVSLASSVKGLDLYLFRWLFDMLHWFYAISQSIYWLQEWYFAKLTYGKDRFSSIINICIQPILLLNWFYMLHWFYDISQSLYWIGRWYLAHTYSWILSFYHRHHPWMYLINIFLHWLYDTIHWFMIFLSSYMDYSHDTWETFIYWQEHFNITSDVLGFLLTVLVWNFLSKFT